MSKAFTAMGGGFKDVIIISTVNSASLGRGVLSPTPTRKVDHHVHVHANVCPYLDA